MVPPPKSWGFPYLRIDFAPTNDNAFLTFRLGSATFWNTKDNEGKTVESTFHFMVFCGVHNGALSNDVLIDTKTALVSEPHASYLPGTDKGREARLAARSSTERTLGEVVPPKVEALRIYEKPARFKKYLPNSECCTSDQGRPASKIGRPLVR